VYRYSHYKTSLEQVTQSQREVLAVSLLGLVLFLALGVLLPVSHGIFGNLFTKPLSHAAGDAFVTHQAGELNLNGQPFRFSGMNMYWLGLDENVGGVDYPTKQRIDDAFSNATSMGATVVRAHTLGISVGCVKCIEPSLGVFNPAAFDSIDYAIKVAGEHRIKLIIPLVDQWNYYSGGKTTFLEWRGLATKTDDRNTKSNVFHTDATVRADFKTYIATILNHKNSYTGIALKDDPTIMAWETGNELFTWNGNWSQEWTHDIALYIKHLAPQQLVADGRVSTQDHAFSEDQYAPALTDPAVDLMDIHQYPMSTSAMLSSVKTATNAGKAVFIGEYDWTNRQGGDPLASYLTAALSSGLSGDLFWSLFPTYVSHNDGYTLHYPGDDDTMKAQVVVLSNHAKLMAMANVSTTTLPTGTPLPSLTPVSTPAATPISLASPTPSPVVPPFTSSTPTPQPSQTTGSSRLFDDTLGTTGLEYAGSSWQHCSSCGFELANQSNSWSLEANATLRFSFLGNQVQYLGVKDAHHGIVAVSFDGGAETLIDLYAPSRQGNVVVWSSPVVAMGTHTVTLRVTGQKNPLSVGIVGTLDAFRVFTQSITRPSLIPSIKPSTIPPITPTRTPTPAPSPGTLQAISVDDNYQGPNTFQFTYDGSWEHCNSCGNELYGQGNSWTHVAGATASITFTGTQIAYYAVKDSHHGIAGVSIDGGTENMVDLYAASREGNALVWTSPELRSGAHTFHIRSTGQRNPASTNITTTLDRVVITTAAANGESSSYDDAQIGVGLSQFMYSANWSHCTYCGTELYAQGNSWSSQPNAHVAFSFNGSQLFYYAVKDHHHGIGAVSIDGGREIMVDLYSSSRQGDTLVWTSPKLTTGPHVFTLRATGNQSSLANGQTVTIDRLAVSP
jgi:mannan endo-1,4-beta-mannosidase